MALYGKYLLVTLLFVILIILIYNFHVEPTVIADNLNEKYIFSQLTSDNTNKYSIRVFNKSKLRIHFNTAYNVNYRDIWCWYESGFNMLTCHIFLYLEMQSIHRYESFIYDYEKAKKFK